MLDINYEVVVGIDFGSSGSGFAYSFMNDKNINHGKIYGADVDGKIPTEIILDKNNNKILEFGKGCEQYLKENKLKSVNYFKSIKMNLYNKSNTIKAYNTGISYPLSKIIQKVLEKLKELALEELRNLRGKIDESHIKWVVTVPAVWEEFQKGIMMEASINAGLIGKDDDKSLFFALEPEAASLYCSRNEDINQELIKEGKYYIICDLGGGTGDIVTHMVGDKKKLKEINYPYGGEYGSNNIDKKIFEDIIEPIFGFKNFEQLLDKYKKMKIEDSIEVIFGSWCNLESGIKTFKEGTNKSKVIEKKNFPITCTLFQDFFDNDYNINIEDLINKFNSNKDYKLKVKSKKHWIIEFPYKIVYNYIKNQADLICRDIKEILNSASASNITIDSLIFVGGYCSNEIITSLIKEGLKNDIKNFLKPSKPSLAIMEGAVLFGINPKIIDTRIAKYTIGLGTLKKWKEEIHSKDGKQIIDKNFDNPLCEDCFDKLIEVKQKLKLDQEIEKSYTSIDPRYCTCIFYKSLKPNPIFIFEEGVEKLGDLKIDAGKKYPPDERSIKIIVKFGGTFINVKAIHEKSNTEVKAILNFDE